MVERYLHGKFKYNVTAVSFCKLSFFTHFKQTVGAAFGAKKVDVNGNLVTLGIWDTAGAG